MSVSAGYVALKHGPAADLETVVLNEGSGRADGDAVADLHDLVQDTEASFAELLSTVDPPDSGSQKAP